MESELNAEQQSRAEHSEWPTAKQSERRRQQQDPSLTHAPEGPISPPQQTQVKSFQVMDLKEQDKIVVLQPNGRITNAFRKWRKPGLPVIAALISAATLTQPTSPSTELRLQCSQENITLLVSEEQKYSRKIFTKASGSYTTVPLEGMSAISKNYQAYTNIQ